VDAISTVQLAKRYGRTTALAGIDLRVEPGVIFGYLGPNGAGKTTTIRILAGLIRPGGGEAAVLGLDVVRQRPQVHRRIGYLPGDFVAYADLTGAEYLRYIGSLRGGVEPAALRRLLERLDLDPSPKIGALSHGNRQKLGIVQAFMHDPELVILDEPTSGLDPLVQHEFLAMLRDARDRGQTVFLSSHVLSEVEAVADVVGILTAGRLAVVQSVSALKAQALRHVDLTFGGPPPRAEIEAASGVRTVTVDGHVLRLVVEGSTAELFKAAAPYGIEQVVTHEPDLEQIFLSYYGEGGPR